MPNYPEVDFFHRITSDDNESPLINVKVQFSVHRVSLGITTNLTMTFLGLEARADLPKVSYPTALDFFVFLSFAFIFATILQFAIVHYHTKYNSGECYFNFLEDSSDSGSEDEEVSSCTQQAASASHLNSLTQIDTIDVYGVIPLSRLEFEDEDLRGSSGTLKSIGRFVRKYFFCISTQERFEGQDEVTSESVVDESIAHRFESETSTNSHSTPMRRHSTQFNSRAKQQRNFRRQFNSVSKVVKSFFPIIF